MSETPVLFLDFDRTLFNTEQFYDWLGDDVSAQLSALMSGELLAENFSAMLFPEVISFLAIARTHYHLVILTFSTTPELQRIKLRESGILKYVDEVIITERDKGLEAKEYLSLKHKSALMHYFVDDTESKIHEVYAQNRNITCYLIDRSKSEMTVLDNGVLVICDLAMLANHLKMR